MTMFDVLVVTVIYAIWMTVRWYLVARWRDRHLTRRLGPTRGISS